MDFSITDLTITTFNPQTREAILGESTGYRIVHNPTGLSVECEGRLITKEQKDEMLTELKQKVEQHNASQN